MQGTWTTEFISESVVRAPLSTFPNSELMVLVHDATVFPLAFRTVTMKGSVKLKGPDMLLESISRWNWLKSSVSLMMTSCSTAGTVNLTLYPGLEPKQ